MSVAHRIGGTFLDVSLTVVLLIASIGSGIAAQIGASRLLYGMGRDGIIPKKFFGHLDKKYSTPNYNIMLIGMIALFGSLLLIMKNPQGSSISEHSSRLWRST
jgi:amino acid transporter